jgi:hypothetical protein
MRARWIATLSAALVLCLQADAAAYCLNVPSALGKPIAWQTIPVTYHVSDNLTDTAILAAIDAAFTTWGSVQCSTLKFTKGAQFKMCTESDINKCPAGTVHFEHGTPYLYVFWYDSSNSSAFPTASTSAAYNYVWYGMIGSISAASLAVNAFQYKWDGNGGDQTNLVFDTQSEIMPLIGAVIGLTESKTAGAVMYPGMTYGSTTKRTLTQDDKDGLVYLYKDASCAAPPAPDPSCGTVVPPTDGGGTTTGDGGGTTTGDGGGTTTGDGGGTTTGDGGGTTTGDGGGTTTGDGGGGGGDDDGCGCVIGGHGQLRTGALLLLLCLGLVLVARRRS